MVQKELMALCLFVAVLFGQFALSGCSMQKSTPKLEKVRTEGVESSVGMQYRAGQKASDRSFHAVGIDYLTPVQKITKPHIFVYKAKRRMYVVQSNVLVRDYPVGLGLNSIGDKEHDKDGRTPEGDFRVSLKSYEAQSEELSDSSLPDGQEPLNDLTVPHNARNTIIALEANNALASDAPHESEVLIRAGGAHRDWTQGCIALYDSDMEELARFVSNGTPVSIRP